MATTWICNICDFENASNTKRCDMCGSLLSDKVDSILTNLQYEESKAISDEYNNMKNHCDDKWQCKQCTLLNSTDTFYCIMCMNEREIVEESNNEQNTVDDKANNTIDNYLKLDTETNEEIKSETNINKEQWKCKQCTCSNHIDLPYCEACLAPHVMDNDDHKQHMQTNEHKEHKAQTHKRSDTDIALQMQTQETEKIKQFYEDLESAQKLIDKDTEKIQQFQGDLESAKQLEEKYQADDIQFIFDRQIALKMQKEFAKGLAWFCAQCFAMNLNIQSFECELCGHKRPKPKLPDVLTVRDQVCMKMIDMLRDVGDELNINCIINLALAQNFVVKYLAMCKTHGLKVAQPQISYHWTRAQFFNPIKQKGLKVPDGHKVKHATDTGYYGKGIYMSPCYKYAQGYGHGAKQFFVALSLTGKQFAAKYPRDLGIGLKKGYDSHMSSDNVNAQTQRANEWVFFKPEQLLLCFQITLAQVQDVTQVLNKVNQYLVSKYDDLQKKGGIRGL